MTIINLQKEAIAKNLPDDMEIAYNIKVAHWNGLRHRTEEYCELFTPRKFSFGQYKDKNIGYICLIDKQYIEWLLNNTDFSLTDREYLMYKPDSITIAECGFKEISRSDMVEFHSPGKVNFEILNTLKPKQ